MLGLEKEKLLLDLNELRYEDLGVVRFSALQ